PAVLSCLLSFVFRDETIDAPAQRQHRDTATRHHGVIELPEVELLAQRVLRLGAQAVDLAVAHLVTAGLSGPGAVTIHFARDFVDRRAVGGREPLDGLLAGPAS